MWVARGDGEITSGTAAADAELVVGAAAGASGDRHRIS